MAAPRLVPLALLFAVSPALAQDTELPPPERYHLRVEYREFRPALTGELQVGAGGFATEVDVKDDLAVDDDRTFELRGAIQFAPGHKLRASYTKLHYTGDTVAGRSFTIDGTRYEATARVVSRLDGFYLSGAYEWDFIRRPAGFLGLVVGAKLVDGDWSVEAPDQGRSEGDEVQLPIPVLGLAGRAYIGRVSLEGEIGGLTLGDHGRLFEGEASARLHLSDRLAVQGGYRVVDARGRENDDRGELRMGGWLFGLELSL